MKLCSSEEAILNKGKLGDLLGRKLESGKLVYNLIIGPKLKQIGKEKIIINK